MHSTQNLRHERSISLLRKQEAGVKLNSDELRVADSRRDPTIKLAQMNRMDKTGGLRRLPERFDRGYRDFFLGEGGDASFFG